MTARTCPACGLQQTLAAPRCARCGAPLDDSVAPAPAAGPAVEDRTVFRPGLATVPPGQSGGQPPQPLPGQPAQPHQSAQSGGPVNTWPARSDRPDPAADQPSAAVAGMPGQTGQQVPPETDPDDHTQQLPPGSVPGGQPAAAEGPSALQRLWRRIIGTQARPDPPGDAPRE